VFPAPGGHRLTSGAALDAEASDLKRVLIIYSFGRDFAPYDAITSEVAQATPRRANGYRNAG